MSIETTANEIAEEIKGKSSPLGRAIALTVEDVAERAKKNPGKAMAIAAGVTVLAITGLCDIIGAAMGE